MTGDRRFSSLIIDGKLLVDVAPQSVAYAQKIGVDFSKITDIFIKAAVERIESRNGHHTIDAAKKLGIGTTDYELINID